jgi:hypothetical protein
MSVLSRVTAIFKGRKQINDECFDYWKLGEVEKIASKFSRKDVCIFWDTCKAKIIQFERGRGNTI